MKKLILLIFIFLIVHTSSQAQIVLNPPDTSGYVELSLWYQKYSWYCFQTCDCDLYQSGSTAGNNWSWTTTGTQLRVMHFDIWNSWYDPNFDPCTPNDPCPYLNWCHRTGHNNYIYDYQTVLEFDISSLIGLGVTEQNFQSATLNNLEVFDSIDPGDPMTLKIHDLYDSSEDGVLSASDFSNFGNPPITTLFTELPNVGVSYNIDVTDAIYNDLFGPGSTEDYSGFVLCCDPSSIYQTPTVIFSPDLPSLTITIIPEVLNLILSKYDEDGDLIEDDVLLEWSEISGAVSYTVMRSTLPDSGFVSIDVVTVPTAIDLDVLFDGTDYYYYVEPNLSKENQEKKGNPYVEFLASLFVLGGVSIITVSHKDS